MFNKHNNQDQLPSDHQTNAANKFKIRNPAPFRRVAKNTSIKDQ